MKSIHIFFLSLVISLFSTSNIYAVRAYPYPVKITQPDGTEITVRLHGDEFFHYKSTIDGFPLVRDKKGMMTYAIQNARGNLISTNFRATNIEKRTSKERKFVQTLNPNLDISKRIQSRRLIRSTVQRVSSSEPSKAYPLSGTPKSLVILVNFSDKSFATPTPKTAFTNLLTQPGYSANGGTGSAKDYFTDNSKGQFIPQFDVVGPFTLPQNLDYYGKNDTNGDDTHAVQMIVDACSMANSNGVDFSQYDTDNNGYVDNIFVYYAGYNEAEHAPENTIWPHRWGIYPGSNYTGTATSVTFDGKRVRDYACSSELRGASGSNMCGIGTFCHEFGHVLGLPDFYATNGATHQTLSSWDIMDYGPYLNLGKTPCGYSAYERFYLNWLKPTEIKSAQSVTIDTLTTSNKAYIITQFGNHNLSGTDPSPIEFFMLENRQKKGWDSYLPGHGLLITHVYYNANNWDNNEPNNDPNAMGVDIVEADGTATEGPGDTYPGTSIVKKFSPTLRSGISFNKPLINITENNGIISFQFIGNLPEITTTGTPTIFSTVNGTPSNFQTISVNGKKLISNIQLSFENNLHFEMKKAEDANWTDTITLSPTDSIISNITIQIRYNPTVPSYKNTHVEKLLLKASGATTTTIDLSGISTRPVYITPPIANEAKNITHTSFIANWEAVEDSTNKAAPGYYLTAYSFADGQSSLTEGFDKGLEASTDWTINTNSTSNSVLYSGTKTPSLIFSNDKEYVISEKYLLPVSSLSFYLRSLAGSNGFFQVEGQTEQGSWEKVDNIPVVTNLYEKNKTYTFDVSKAFNRFRFTYTKGVGSVTFDDVKVTFNKLLSYKFRERWITKTSDTLTNLIPNTEYFYTVKASDKDAKYENITLSSNTISVKTLNDISIFKNNTDSQVVYTTKDGVIIFKTPKTTDLVSIYNTIGQQVIAPFSPKSDVVEINNLARNKIYIVKIGNKSIKIVL